MLDIKQISDCLFALNQLSFKDHDTLERLCTQLETEISETDSAPVLRSILTSLGQLRYLHGPVVDNIIRWHQRKLDNGHQMATKDMINILKTCATLNYNPQQHSSLLEHISSNIKSEDMPDDVWLDAVWSLSLLGKASNSQIQSVLSPDFYTQLLFSSSSSAVAVKLLNINAAARMLFANYDGPFIKVADDEVFNDVKVSQSVSKAQFNQSVMEAFTTLFPPPRLLRTNVNTLLGSVVEGEFVCDLKGKPLLIHELTNNFGNTDSEKPLPPNSLRMVIVTAGFQDCLIGGEISGLTDFNIRLLEATGYKVFLVKYTEWQPATKLVARVKQLDERLKKLLESWSKI